MRLLMMPKGKRQVRIIEVNSCLVLDKLEVLAWWRRENPRGFGLTFTHLINDYSHIFLWEEDQLRDIGNEIKPTHFGRTLAGVARDDYSIRYRRRRSVGDVTQ